MHMIISNLKITQNNAMKLNILPCLFTLLLLFSSCKKDEVTTASALTGTWMEATSTEQMSWTFNTNGSGVYQMKNCTTGKIIDGPTSFTYTYDSSSKKISFTGMDITTAYVEVVSSNSIQLFSTDLFSGTSAIQITDIMYKQ